MSLKPLVYILLSFNVNVLNKRNVGRRYIWCEYSYVNMIGLNISADLGGSSNDSKVVFEG